MNIIEFDPLDKTDFKLRKTDYKCVQYELPEIINLRNDAEIKEWVEHIVLDLGWSMTNYFQVAKGYTTQSIKDDCKNYEKELLK